ncbi:MAG: CAP domain-containing protein [Alphaproteobacteria bacterium]|nr:CAP domain-containing protein [Alphaproteobacteria bacterium]
MAPGTITASAKQVLAPNAALDRAAEAHALWMLDTDTVSHSGATGWRRRGQ